MKLPQPTEVNTMKIRAAIFTLALCSYTIALPSASAQTAQSAHADIVNATGQKIGTANFSSSSGGVRIDVDVTQLPRGTHGIHIHTVGTCERPDFKTARRHRNLAGKMHVMDNPES